MSTESEPSFEHAKFARMRAEYGDVMDRILSLGFSQADLVHYFPAFAGKLTLARYLSLYELYKQCTPLAGHIAEVGVYKAGCTLLMAKLVEIFEPNSLTLVHGFDWFLGAQPTDEEKFVKEGECACPEETVQELINAQKLDSIVRLHNMDVAHDLPRFFEQHPHLQFKLVFLDCGIYEVVRESLRAFWPRLTVGGILILDHYSHEFAPGEMRAVREELPGVTFRQIPFGWMPAAYAVKET